MRVVEPERLAEFYAEVFELPLQNSSVGPGSYALSDGRMTMHIIPWKISDFLGTGIERPAPDHLGFEVESLDAFKKDLVYLLPNHQSADDPEAAGVGPEGDARTQDIQENWTRQFSSRRSGRRADRCE